jgi:hypothetical protein
MKLRTWLTVPEATRYCVHHAEDVTEADVMRLVLERTREVVGSICRLAGREAIRSADPKSDTVAGSGTAFGTISNRLPRWMASLHNLTNSGSSYSRFSNNETPDAEDVRPR